jgi:S1-C subfamily serine protease
MDHRSHKNAGKAQFRGDLMHTDSHSYGWRLAAGMTVALAVGLGPVGSPAAAAPAPAPSGGADSAVPQLTPQLRAINLVQPSVVMVRTDWTAYVDIGADERIRVPLPTACTAAIVSSDGYIVTAGHCVDAEQARRDAIREVVTELIDLGLLSGDVDEQMRRVTSGRNRWVASGEDRDSPPDSELQVQLGGGVVTWPRVKVAKDGVNAKVVKVMPFAKGDVALLKIDETDLPVALLASGKAQIGQELLSIGYPLAQVSGDEAALTFQNGQINAVNTVGVRGPGNDFYQTSADLTRGMSGGPAVGFGGEILGLASITIDKSNFIVPSPVVVELLRSNQVKNELGRVDTLYRAGLEDFYHGYYSDAIRSFEQVAAIAPTHQLAKQKVREAADLRQQFGDQARPVPPAPAGNQLLVRGALAAGAVLLLALVAGAIWFVRRRRGTAPAGVYAPVLAGPATPSYGRDPMDDDTHVGYDGPLYRSGPYPPAFAGEPDSAPPASATPWSTPPAATPSSAPLAATPSSTPPAATPSWTSPAASAPVAQPAPASWASRDANPPVSAPAAVGRAGAQHSPLQPQSAGFCPHCGAPRSADHAFCSSCGARLGASTVRPD